IVVLVVQILVSITGSDHKAGRGGIGESGAQRLSGSVPAEHGLVVRRWRGAVVATWQTAAALRWRPDPGSIELDLRREIVVQPAQIVMPELVLLECSRPRGVVHGTVGMLNLGHVAFKEEQLVPEDAAADRGARVLDTVVILFRAEEFGQIRVGKGLLPVSTVARIDRASGEFVFDEPMEIIGPAASRDIHHTPGSAAVLGFETGALDLDLLHKLKRERIVLWKEA